MIKRYSELNTIKKFYLKHNIDPEEWDFLGSGAFGTAYAVGDDRVLKITNSESEFKIAKEIEGKKIPGIVNIYVAEFAGESPLSRRYFILQEMLEEDSSIEDLFPQVSILLDTQGLPITYIGHFDMDEYEEEHGEIYPEVKEFFEELSEVIRVATSIVGDAVDIHSENLGRDKEGNLKAFDLDDKRQNQ